MSPASDRTSPSLSELLLVSPNFPWLPRTSPGFSTLNTPNSNPDTSIRFQTPTRRVCARAFSTSRPGTRAPLRTRGLRDHANGDTHRHTAKVRRELDADAERRRVQRILLTPPRDLALLSMTHAKDCRLTDNQRYSHTPVPVNHSAASHPHMAHMATTSADVLTISHDRHPDTHIARDHSHAPRDTFPPTATLARTCSRQPLDVGTWRTWRRRTPTSSPSPTTTTGHAHRARSLAHPTRHIPTNRDPRAPAS